MLFDVRPEMLVVGWRRFAIDRVACWAAGVRLAECDDSVTVLVLSDVVLVKNLGRPAEKQSRSLHAVMLSNGIECVVCEEQSSTNST